MKNDKRIDEINVKYKQNVTEDKSKKIIKMLALMSEKGTEQAELSLYDNKQHCLIIYFVFDQLSLECGRRFLLTKYEIKNVDHDLPM